MRKLILLAVLISTIANAQMSNTERQEFGDVNVIENAGAENGLQRWTNAGGGTFAIENGASVAIGSRSFSWDASAASDTLTSSQAAIPVGLQNRFCYASFLYKGGDSNITAEVIDGSLTVLASKALTSQTDFSLGELGFTCPSSGTVAFRLSASADAAILYLDQVFVGIRAANVTHSVSPTVYELSKQSIGEPGIVDNTKGTLTESFFPDSTDLQFWSLDGDSNGDAASSPINLTQNGSPAFDVQGIFGGNVLRQTGTTSGVYSDDSFFQLDPASVDFSVGGWMRIAYNVAGQTPVMFGIGDPGGSAMLQLESQGDLSQISDNAGLTFSTTGLESNKLYHWAYTYDSSGTLASLYLNGKLVATNTGALTNVANERFTIGLSRSLTTSVSGLSTFEDVFFKKTLLTESEINAIYSRRFEGQQIKAGHVLDADSFPSSIASGNRVFYHLDDLNDDSGNSKTLTNNNSVTFSGFDIFGVAGVAEFDGTNSLDSSDTYFADNLGTQWAIGGWYLAEDWSDAGTFIAIRENAPNLGPRIESFAGEIYGSASEDGSTLTVVRFDVPDYFIDGSWHHLILASDGTNLNFYIDGVNYKSVPFTGQAAITAPFSIGSRYSGAVPGGYFTGGRAQEIVYINGLVKDDDVRKLYSAKISHNQTVTDANQQWYGNFYKGDNSTLVNELDQDWLLDKKSNFLYIETGLEPEDSLSLRLQNQSFSATSIPPKTFTTGLLEAAPSFPINTGLPCSPQDFYVRTEGQSLAGQWDKRFDLLSVTDSGTLNGDVSSLTIDASHRLEIVAGCVAPAMSFNLDNFDLLITKDISSGDLFVPTGKTLFRPNLEIASGDTFTINGTFNTVGEVTGSGTLAGTGTVSSIDEQQVYPLDKTFQEDVTFQGDLIFSPTQLSDSMATKLGYKEYTSVTIGHTNAYSGFSASAKLLPYQTQSGSWRLKGNIETSWSSTTVSNLTLTIDGIKFSAANQAISWALNSSVAVEERGFTVSGTNQIFLNLSSSVTTGDGYVSLDVSLASKPTWAY